MTASIEYIPVTPIEYPDEDGKPMAEGDIQCSYLTKVGIAHRTTSAYKGR